MSVNWYLKYLPDEQEDKRVEINPMSYRVFVRAEDSSAMTLQMTAQGDRLIDESSDILLRKHLKQHSPATKQQSVRLGAHKRARDIVLHDANISRSHAMLFHNGDSLSLADLMSTNGCFVNGEPVSDVDLQDGDELRLGQTRFRVVMTEEIDE